jgi:hypothetical protein
MHYNEMLYFFQEVCQEYTKKRFPTKSAATPLSTQCNQSILTQELLMKGAPHILDTPLGCSSILAMNFQWSRRFAGCFHAASVKELKQSAGVALHFQQQPLAVFQAGKRNTEFIIDQSPRTSTKTPWIPIGLPLRFERPGSFLKKTVSSCRLAGYEFTARHFSDQTMTPMMSS